MHSERQLSEDIQAGPQYRVAILWDMDGIFSDGEPPFAAAQLLALKELMQYLHEDVEITSKKFLKELDEMTRGRSSQQIYIEMVERFFDHQDSEEKKSQFVEALGNAINKHNLAEIDKLEKQGKYLFADTVAAFLECATHRIPMAIVTGSLKVIAEHTRALLAERAADKATREFILEMPTFTPEDYAPASKPDPGPYSMGLEHMKDVHKVEDAIVIEDSPSGVQAGVRAGCVTIVRNDLSDGEAAAKIKQWVPDCGRIHSKITFETLKPLLKLDQFTFQNKIGNNVLEEIPTQIKVL